MSTLTDKLASAELHKSLFAAVGAADLALEQVKDVPAELGAEAKRVQARVDAARAAVPGQLKTLPTQVKGLRGELESRLSQAAGSATDLYAKLAIRGERLVTQIRRQPATEAAIAEGKEAVKKAEAAAIAARNSVRAGERAVTGAAGKLG